MLVIIIGSLPRWPHVTGQLKSHLVFVEFALYMCVIICMCLRL